MYTHDQTTTHMFLLLALTWLIMTIYLLRIVDITWTIVFPIFMILVEAFTLLNEVFA